MVGKPGIVVVVISILCILYFYFLIESPLQTSLNEYSISISARGNVLPSKGLVDAIAYISMGRLSNTWMIDYSISSLRKLGKWNGDVYIITDSPDCFEDAVKKYNIKTIYVPTVEDIIHIKLLKSKLMDILPKSVNNVLYLDADIIVSRSLDVFFRDLNKCLLQQKAETIIDKSDSIPTAIESLPFDFAAFPDAKGHYFGFCSGCEKWHTGVMLFRRGHGLNCLKSWGDILLSGKYDTDQESIDFAEESGACSNALTLPPKHLLFAKDYVGMIMTSGQTFIHATSAVRIEGQDFFYKDWILPRIHSSLNPPLNPQILYQTPKLCKARVEPISLPKTEPSDLTGNRKRKRKRPNWIL